MMSTKNFIKTMDGINMVLSIQKMISKEVLNFNEARLYLQISQTRLRKLANNGEIPCMRTGKRKMHFNSKDLQTWLSKNELKSHSKPLPMFRPHYVKERSMSR